MSRRRLSSKRFRSIRAGALLGVLAAGVVFVAAQLPGGPPRDGSGDRPELHGPPRERPLDPGSFAPGACVALAPTQGERHRTVFLDAGHGGIDPGGVGVTQSGQRVEESTVNLAVELDAAASLRARGFRVVVSRTADTTVVRLRPADTSAGALSVAGAHADVAARARCADLAGAGILIGIYMDAGSSPSNAGCVTGYDADRTFSADNRRLATLLQRDVLAAMNAKGWAIPDEGVLTDDVLGSSLTSRGVAYGHLLLLGPADPPWFATPSSMPGALIEPLFLTDPFEGSIAAGATGQRVIAAGLVQAVDQYFAPPPRPA